MRFPLLHFLHWMILGGCGGRGHLLGVGGRSTVDMKRERRNVSAFSLSIARSPGSTTSTALPSSLDLSYYSPHFPISV